MGIQNGQSLALASPAHMAQGRQAKAAAQSQAKEPPQLVAPIYTVGTPYYALYCGPRCERDPRWVPAVVTKVFGSRSVNVRVFPRGGTWRRHIEQLRPRYGVDQDADPGEVPAPAGTLKGDPLVQETAETTPVIALNSEVAAPCTTMETSGQSQEPGQSK